MEIAKKVREFITKLQQLPEIQKKVIFFAVLILAVVVAGFFQIRSTMKNISNIQTSLGSMKLPEFTTLEKEEPAFKVEDIEALFSEVSGGDQEVFER